MPRAERLLLLDSASLYFRAWFGVPDTVRAPDGSPVNAVRGFLEMIARLIDDRHATRLVACWDDDWRPAFRTDALPSYKAHRVADDGGEEVDDGLSLQVPIIVDVLAALGIARVGAAGYEADDVMATLAARESSRSGGAPVDVVTGDRDVFQVVDDAHPVRVLYTAKGLRDLDVVDEARLRERYGLDPSLPAGDAYADLALLRGDPSDGLPGVPRIGEKTAAALLARYRDLAGIRVAVANSDPGLTRAQLATLQASSDYLDVAPVVVRVARDAPLPEVADALPHSPADPEALARLVERWGLESPVGRMQEALNRAVT